MKTNREIANETPTNTDKQDTLMIDSPSPSFMNWKEIKDIAFFCFIFVLSINLIEYEANSFIVEIAGDLFGALALSFMAIERALRD